MKTTKKLGTVLIALTLLVGCVHSDESSSSSGTNIDAGVSDGGQDTDAGPCPFTPLGEPICFEGEINVAGCNCMGIDYTATCAADGCDYECGPCPWGTGGGGNGSNSTSGTGGNGGNSTGGNGGAGRT